MITIIAAINKNRGIGLKNKLLYDIPEDRKLFKDLTLGKVVIMGRKTWLSLPHKPLPGRTNVVISRHTISLRKALELYKDKDICIIGGGKIYKQAMRYADELSLTVIHDDKKKAKRADTFFPVIPTEYFDLVAMRELAVKADYSVTHEIWRRKK